MRRKSSFTSFAVVSTKKCHQRQNFVLPLPQVWYRASKSWVMQDFEKVDYVLYSFSACKSTSVSISCMLNLFLLKIITSEVLFCLEDMNHEEDTALPTVCKGAGVSGRFAPRSRRKPGHCVETAKPVLSKTVLHHKFRYAAR